MAGANIITETVAGGCFLSPSHLGSGVKAQRPIPPQNGSAAIFSNRVLLTERQWRQGILDALHNVGSDSPNGLCPAASVFTFDHDTSNTPGGQ